MIAHLPHLKPTLAKLQGTAKGSNYAPVSFTWPTGCSEYYTDHLSAPINGRNPAKARYNYGNFDFPSLIHLSAYINEKNNIVQTNHGFHHPL